MLLYFKMLVTRHPAGLKQLKHSAIRLKTN